LLKKLHLSHKKAAQAKPEAKALILKKIQICTFSTRIDVDVNVSRGAIDLDWVKDMAASIPMDDGEVRAPIAATRAVLSENPLGQWGTARKHSSGFNPKAPSAVFEMFRDLQEEAKHLQKSTKFQFFSETHILLREN
jgi:hypothetical protein